MALSDRPQDRGSWSQQPPGRAGKACWQVKKGGCGADGGAGLAPALSVTEVDTNPSATTEWTCSVCSRWSQRGFLLYNQKAALAPRGQREPGSFKDKLGG